MKNNPFHHTTLTDRIADIIGTTLAVLFVIISLLVIISVTTIIGVETASEIWGDENVIYWISNLF